MEIEGMTLEQVKYNIYAFGAQAKRFARKRDAARKDHTRAHWQKKFDEALGYQKNNEERLARFEAVEHIVAADLPTECPHGHGDLIIDHDHVYCDFCSFSASR